MTIDRRSMGVLLFVTWICGACYSAWLSPAEAHDPAECPVCPVCLEVPPLPPLPALSPEQIEATQRALDAIQAAESLPVPASPDTDLKGPIN